MKKLMALAAVVAAAVLAGCSGMAYRGINDSLSRDAITINMGGAGVTNGSASATAGTQSNGTYTVAGGVNVVILKNVQLYNGGGTAASNDTRFVLEIPAGAMAQNPEAETGYSVCRMSPPEPVKPAEVTKILAMGDSWASARRSDTGVDDGWPEALEFAEGLRQGVDGSTAVEWAADKNGMLTKALNTDAERVVISLGGSDAFAIQRNPVNVMGKVSEACMALNTVVTKIQNKFGKENVLVLLYANPWPDRADAVVAAEALRMVMKGACPEGTQFWDTGVFLDASCFSNGDYHPNAEGTVREANDLCERLGYTPPSGRGSK